MATDFDAQVRALLMDRRGEWQAVARASGVSYSWLSKFANGHIPNPGFATLRKLYLVLRSDLAAAEKEAKSRPASLQAEA